MKKITDKIAALPDGSTYFSLEFFPPKTQVGFDNFLPRLTRLARLQPLFVTVTWGAGGSTATKSIDLAAITQRQLGLTTCLHLTCTNMRRSVLDQALERCKELGVRNVLALRGDEPREEEYDMTNGHAEGENGSSAEKDTKFEYAVDLVRYIRRKYGDYFCIGVAAYPEGHATSVYAPSQSPEHDIPFLVEKTTAGADFLMTQLFYDVEAFLRFEKLLREHPSGAFKDIPIIPGLMPVQSWGILTRTTKLSCAKVPPDLWTQLEQGKGDDELVKALGVHALQGIVEKIKTEMQSNMLLTNAKAQSRKRKSPPQGFHFYTLNLEKVVAQILERCDLIPLSATPTEASQPNDTSAIADDIDGAGNTLNGDRANGASDAIPIIPKSTATADRRRLSSANSTPRNRVVVSSSSNASEKNAAFEAREDEAGVPQDKKQTRANALATSEGEGSLGRAATWDDYPNGRWGDARSPAYGSIDGYGPTLHVSPSTALSIWGQPTTTREISTLFQRYLTGQLSALPWSEEPLSAETALIRAPLERMNERGWWSVASQPAVDAAKSSDEILGWGPKSGGWVWQKPFVEFFLPSSDWKELKAKLDGAGVEFTYFAGNAAGDFEASDEASVNPVTWGSFKGKEIITPTIIEAVSFRAWQDEAFALWREWQRVYPPGSPSSRLLGKTCNDVWLVNVIGHVYQDGGERLWEMLLDR